MTPLYNSVYIFLIVCLIACDGRQEIKHHFKSGELHLKKEINSQGHLDGMYYEYYQNGNLKYKAQYKDGKLNGESRSYLNDGTVVEIANYENNVLDDSLYFFYDTGEIMEKHYYVDGRLLDFKRFTKNGEQDKRTVALYNLNKDTFSLGEEIEMLANIGNNYKNKFDSGNLIITNNFDETGKITDTLLLISSPNNNYIYNFKSTKQGWDTVYACIVNTIDLDSLEKKVIVKHYFKQPYFTK